ncbi:MFS transporter [Vampirovibrio sp.]|uniref:MFS transporter n=1 Tax=Vampirovibrio sp. TaxID=2717857 RepID=UPI00359306F6
MPQPPTTDQALREKNFLIFSMGSFISMLGRQMLAVAIGWDIYEKTHSALALGLVGLAQLLPVILLTLPVGHWVDNHDRRKVLIFAQIINAAATGGLIFLSLTHGPVQAMYACLFLAGIGRAFHSPANAALLPQVVSERNFTNAVTWSSIFFQAAAILGPALGGLLIGLHHNATLVYTIDCLASLIFWGMLGWVKVRSLDMPKQAMTLKSMLSGLAFVVKTRLILAAITLDLFAVLFGGAVALLPIYAKDILQVGPSGLGWLQMAPSLGAIIMGLVLARYGNFRNSGKWLLYTVAGFGVTTIVFGLSTHFWLSFFMLFLAGACDNVSVVIRQALVLLRTPDEMRGRVSAINYVFIGTSNELGGFESGTVAYFLGPVFSVVFGGFATIATVIATALLWPELRKLDWLHEPNPNPKVQS